MDEFEFFEVELPQLVGEAVFHTQKKNRLIVPVSTSGLDEIMEDYFWFSLAVLEMWARLALVLVEGDYNIRGFKGNFGGRYSRIFGLLWAFLDLNLLLLWLQNFEAQEHPLRGT
jgi:hypothetical protein